MVTTFTHLPESQDQKLRQVIPQIVAAIEPDKIICYGTRTTLLHTWSAFSRPTDPVAQTDYDLLVVTSTGEYRKDPILLDIMDKCSTDETRLIIIVHTLCSVNEALEQGRTFFSTLYHNGVLLHDASGIPLSAPAVYNKAEHLAELQSHWSQYFGLAEKFLDGASYYITSGSSTLAVFMLHQATEHTCVAIIKACLDYRATTHSISRLLALTENFSLISNRVFPQISGEEAELFKILHRAYSDARYNENFTLSVEKAKVLRDRVKALQDMAQKIYYEKIEAIRSNKFTLDDVVGLDGNERTNEQ